MPRKKPATRAAKRKTAPAGDPHAASVLTDLLAALPSGPLTEIVRSEVARLRRLATKSRPRPKTSRARLLAAISDADADYLRAVSAGSHQAADRCRRQRIDLEAELAALDGPAPPSRGASTMASPSDVRTVWLTTHLLEIEGDLDYLRRTEQWSLIPPLDTRAIALRNELDDARTAAGVGALTLDRSPAAVAAAVLERAKRIEQLAAAETLACAEEA